MNKEDIDQLITALQALPKEISTEAVCVKMLISKPTGWLYGNSWYICREIIRSQACIWYNRRL